MRSTRALNTRTCHTAYARQISSNECQHQRGHRQRRRAGCAAATETQRSQLYMRCRVQGAVRADTPRLQSRANHTYNARCAGTPMSRAHNGERKRIWLWNARGARGAWDSLHNIYYRTQTKPIQTVSAFVRPLIAGNSRLAGPPPYKSTDHLACALHVDTITHGVC